jgi:hypothetical protein
MGQKAMLALLNIHIWFRSQLGQYVEVPLGPIKQSAAALKVALARHKVCTIKGDEEMREQEARRLVREFALS